ncbi:MAG TPA: hypothetical protein VE990_00645 [Acidimicrobiales bacterium]|nr:hypothetical protein [Acidimicrobiales bacterium]
MPTRPPGAPADRSPVPSDALAGPVGAPDLRRRWLSGRAVAGHAALAVWAPGCLVAGWWQATRALDGNALSYLYSVEWPVLAILGAIAWWNFVHDDPETVGSKGLRLRLRQGGAEAAPRPPVGAGPAWTDEGDPEMAAYNEYLTRLAASGQRKTWRRG